MSGNPRKFSEKIALMRAKEAEGDAAFHQILTQVSSIKKSTDTVSVEGLKVEVYTWSCSTSSYHSYEWYDGYDAVF